MIERLYAKNYRAFEEIDVELSKINLFFGPNNSGKSSIISILNLLSQTLNSSDQSVPLLLRGGKEDLGSFRDLVHKHDVKKEIEIGFQVHEKLRKLPFIENSGPVRGETLFKFSYLPKRQEIRLKVIELKYPSHDLEYKIEHAKSYNSNKYYIKERTYKGKKESMNKQISYLDHFIPRISDFDEKVDIIQYFFNQSIYSKFKSIEYIGPFREPPHRTYMYSGESPSSVGIRGERAIDIMTMDYLKQKGGTRKHIFENVSDFFKKSGISDYLGMNKLSDRHFEVVLSKSNSNSEESIADVGYGCSQILPILVAGYNLNPGQILIVEEPEIHLHPKAQAELGSFFYDLAEKQIQTIIETHSEHLLLRLQAIVADPNCKLTPDDLRIYYVYMENGERKIKLLKLNESGYFIDDWPQGFFPERYLEAKKIAKKSVIG